MDKKVELVVLPVKVQLFPNEYSERLNNEMYKESIEVDPLTCVYRQWASTRYTLDGMPTAQMFD